MDEGAEDEGNMMACLQRCDAKTLRQLKAVSAGWQQRARRALWERLCFRQGSQPQSLDGVEELDVEGLQHVGLHEAVAAVRQMPNLARLRGYGFRVELDGPQGVRQAALDGADRSAPLGGAALRRCIHAEPPHERLDDEGEGEPPREPPHELLLAAVACAAPGTVHGVPVQQLREDGAIGSLDMSNLVIGVFGAELLSLMLPVATSLRELRVSGNNIGDRGASALAAVLKETRISKLILDRNNIGDDGTSALAAILKETQITHLGLQRNNLGPEGGAALAEGLKGNSTLQVLE